MQKHKQQYELFVKLTWEIILSRPVQATLVAALVPLLDHVHTGLNVTGLQQGHDEVLHKRLAAFHKAVGLGGGHDCNQNHHTTF